MGILLKIVYRNLREHKVKTLIIGIIVAFGMYILIAGNSIIDTVTAGIKSNFIEYNTGHIVIFPSSLENPSLLGGGPEAFEQLPPVIPDFPAVADTVSAEPRVVAINPEITGAATMQFDEEGSGFAQLIGVDPQRYRTFFPHNLTIVEGRFLEPGEEGIVISTRTADFLEETSGTPVKIGDSIILTSNSSITGTKIREVSVVGIFKANVASQLMTSYIDGQNMRVLAGLTRISDLKAALTTDEQQSLGAVNEDELFGAGDDLIGTDSGSTDKNAGSTVESLLGDSEERARLNEVDPNAWNYLLVRIDDGSKIARVVRDLNDRFAKDGLEVTAYSWIDAAGQVAELTAAMRLIFNIIILIIAVVAVIIIMNTLVISVTERIGEIGTMRAMGAQKRFVRRMIILETLIIVGVFGTIGIAAGSATVIIVRALQLETQNLILQMLVGGSLVQPILTVGSVVFSLIGMALAGVFASLYPATLALRIEPRQAMASH